MVEKKTKNGEENIIFLQFFMHNFVKQFGVKDSIKSANKNTVSYFELFLMFSKSQEIFRLLGTIERILWFLSEILYSYFEMVSYFDWI